MGAGEEHNAILTSGPGLKFLYTINIDDGPSVDTNENLRVELFFNIGKSRAEQMRGVAESKTHIVALGFNSVHLISTNKEDSLTVFDSESFKIPGAGLEVF